jgi:hypothetical protein
MKLKIALDVNARRLFYIESLQQYFHNHHQQTFIMLASLEIPLQHYSMALHLLSRGSYSDNLANFYLLSSVRLNETGNSYLATEFCGGVGSDLTLIGNYDLGR